MTKPTEIGSVRTFLGALDKFDRKKDVVFFYRGHASFTYELKPSVYRDKRWIENEDVMFKELILRCPSDFPSLFSTFQTLVKMQHYALPTRLLDLTTNPLIALFFACDPTNRSSESGEILVFCVPINEIKYYDSDTVSVIANISRCPKTFSVPSVTLSKQQFNQTAEMRYLLHEIKQEKPYFEAEIVRTHLESVVCVKPKMENPRIIRQDGAFFLFGVDGAKATNASVPERYLASNDTKRILINGKKKIHIRNQLEALGISKATVYPEIEKVAEFIKIHYTTK